MFIERITKCQAFVKMDFIHGSSPDRYYQIYRANLPSNFTFLDYIHTSEYNNTTHEWERRNFYDHWKQLVDAARIYRQNPELIQFLAKQGDDFGETLQDSVEILDIANDFDQLNNKFASLYTTANPDTLIPNKKWEKTQKLIEMRARETSEDLYSVCSNDDYEGYESICGGVEEYKVDRDGVFTFEDDVFERPCMIPPDIESRIVLDICKSSEEDVLENDEQSDGTDSKENTTSE